mgnify:FL=1
MLILRHTSNFKTISSEPWDNIKTHQKRNVIKFAAEKTRKEVEDIQQQAEIPGSSYKKITLKQSRKMQHLSPCPQKMLKRRNAICEEIEKEAITDNTGCTLYTQRMELLQWKTLKEMFFV